MHHDEGDESMLTAERSYGLAIMAVGAALVALFAAAGIIGAFGAGVPQELWAAAGALTGALVGVLIPAPTAPMTVAASTAVLNVHNAALDAATKTAQTFDQPADKPAATEALKAVRETAAQPPASGRVRAAVSQAVSQHRAVAASSDPGTPGAQVTQAAADAADTASTTTVARFTGVPWLGKGVVEVAKPVGLAAITYVAFRVGIHMSDGAISYPSCTVTSTVPANVQPAPCATALFQAATAMIALGSAGGGALIGLFVPSPSSKSGS